VLPEPQRDWKRVDIGHGVRAKRSKSGAMSFDVLDTEAARAAIQ
jgi:hypothetical protein